MFGPRMVEISANIINDSGKLTQFYDELKSTNPIYECSDQEWRKFQQILSMMAESLPNFMMNSDQLTQFTNVRTILTASKQGIQAILMMTA